MISEMSAGVSSQNAECSGAQAVTRKPDEITVHIIPEKKGIFLKHTEYEIVSQTYKVSVQRRYNDFLNLHTLLLQRFPFRMLPRVPPKQLMLESLLEERRKGLQQYLQILSEHPVIGESALLRVFLTDVAIDHQIHLRKIVDSELDEFAGLKSDVDLPLGDQDKLAHTRELIRTILTAMTRIKHLIEQRDSRLQCQIRDLEEMSSIFRLIGASQEIFHDSTFIEYANGIKEVQGKYSALASQAISDRIHYLLAILEAHGDLCERVEKGITDHREAASKMLTITRQRMQGIVHGSTAGNVAALQEKEVQQTDVVDTKRRRSAFGVYCVLQETKTVRGYLQSLPSIILSMVFEESKRNTEVAAAWQKMIKMESDKLN